MDALFYLTVISILFLFGVFASMLSKKLKTSDVLLLVIFGFLMREFFIYFNIPMLPSSFINITALFALALIIFDSASRLKFKEFDTFSFISSKLFFIFLAFNFLILTPLTMTLFNLNLLNSLIFSNLMSATAFEVLSLIMKKTNNKVTEILTMESIINAPFTVIIPFLLIDFFKNNPNLNNFSLYIMPFLQEIISGIGAGVLMGVITFKLMRRKYSENLSPIALLTSVLLTYVLAEQLNGSGVLAVTVLGLFFGNSYIKRKQSLQEFSSTTANSIKILVFLLFGMSISLPKSWDFLIKSLLLFIVYVAVRLLSVEVSLPGLNFKEKFFLTFTTPKGITLATVSLTLVSLSSSFFELNNLLFLMFLYSLLTAMFFVHKSDWFLNRKVEKVAS